MARDMNHTVRTKQALDHNSRHSSEEYISNTDSIHGNSLTGVGDRPNLEADPFRRVCR